MATVTYDDRSFLVDGRRLWLVSGSVHYFRVPRELWRDRLLKARRAGLNCIATPVAWNFHEPREGQWHMDRQRDVGAFVRLAGELGLYVILRPGPYIGAAWDFGGLPPWLAAKSGMAPRTANAAYMHYFDKYFAQVLTPLAELQVTRGGNIILVQNESGYVWTTMPDRLNYLGFVSQLLRRSGFEVPIITCNALSDPPVPETIETIVTAGSEVRWLKRLRQRQPSAPMLVTGFRQGPADVWGAEHVVRPPGQLARRAMEVLGCGAQYNYAPWYGGTNVAFWGGRSAGGSAAYHTTSHDGDAPLAEGGGLTEKYYATRPVNLFACHMGRFLADAVMDVPGVSIDDSTEVLNLTGPRGRWAVVTNHGREEIDAVAVSLPDGAAMQVPLGPFGAAAVCADVELSGELTLDYANVTPLGFFWDHILVFHGPAGWPARISLNGRQLRQTIPDKAEPAVFDHGPAKVVLVNSELATRTWPLEEAILFGPDFVGETDDDVVRPSGASHYAVLSAEGTQSRRKYKTASSASRPQVRLRPWKRFAVCVEPVADDLAWRKLDRPRDVDRLGLHHGYVWYRLEVTAPRARRRHLFLPDCEDRATLFVNGALAGVWGRGPGARRKPIGAAFKRGRNVVTLLVDNLGRFCQAGEPKIEDPKGLFGHIHEAKPLRTAAFTLRPCQSFTRRLVPRQLSHLVAELESTPAQEARLSIPLRSVTPVHLAFDQMPGHLCILCNERLVRFFPKRPAGGNFGSLTLGPELKKGTNALKFLLWGDVGPKTLTNVTFHLLTENLTAKAAWFVRPWTMPEAGGPVVGKNRPAWYAARFKFSGAEEPLFVRIAGAVKGQLFLNGHNCGRFWTVGPQEFYHLPACWLREDNELVVFEEAGHIPTGSKLLFRPAGPYR
jgi:hypothetical protein